ncbi:Xaa-Pro peptidase family protein [Methylocapsa sp. S129]|uniref:M24 family metallopeptidase n=1 Tax=Methylocapsa sp. S129 TaxID=1641869 RepID=UPI00131AA451|nr:Xaa-Pro peptidase family protein [Methylocapsa sp. S129]
MDNHLGATAVDARQATPPFDSERLDKLLDEAGIDALVISSKHNIQYLFGGYRFFFFDHFDAIGVSRYLPLLVYVKGRPDQSTYIGHSMESYERDLGKFWTPSVQAARGSLDAAQLAADHLGKIGPKLKRIGVERAFLPADADELLRRALSHAELVEAHLPLERLRARKTPAELDHLRKASDLVVDSMLAVIAGHGPGASKLELTEALRREEVNRGLTFEYCLITAGANCNRAPSAQTWGEGEILSLDSGGNFKGYIGDLCRMAIHGEPDAELKDLLAEVDEIQMAARKPIRAGALGRDIYASANPLVERSGRGNSLEFVAHGMGLVSHEAPRLTARGPVPYPAYDADRPLETGMVISIETTLQHPRRGFIKLEDTVAVTDNGWEAFGDHGRGWNRGGVRAS